MALAHSVVFEVRSGGSENNGGGFNRLASGVDYTQQNAAQASGTNLTVHATTNTDVLPDGYSAIANDVGNCIQITSGAGFTAGIYEIKSIQAGGYWRLDRSPAATTTSGGVWFLGGGFASPGKAAGYMSVPGMAAFIKTGTYVITTASTNVSGGCINLSSPVAFIGYNTNRSYYNTDTKPVLQLNAGVSSANIFTFSGVSVIQNLELDGNNNTTSTGVNGTLPTAVNCHGKNFTNTAFKCTVINCSATTCTTQTVFTSTAYNCVAYANSVSGFSGVAVNCLSINNTGATTDGFTSGGGPSFINCTAYGNGRDGFRMVGTGYNTLINCLATNNAAYGFNVGGYHRLLANCAHYNNTSGGVTISSTVGYSYELATIALTGDPFTNAAGNDFSLNTTSGAGAALRSAGFPTTFPTLSTSQYLDIGAGHHQDPAGGGGMILSRVFGGF